MYDSCNLMDCSPPGYSSTAFSRQDYCSGLPFPSSQPRAQTWVSWIADRFFTEWATKFKSQITCRNKIVNHTSQLPSLCSFCHMMGGEGSSLGTLPMNAILLFRESGLLETSTCFVWIVGHSRWWRIFLPEITKSQSPPYFVSHATEFLT